MEIRAASPASAAVGTPAKTGEASASYFAQTAFTWLSPLFVKANRQGAEVQLSDLMPLTAQDDPRVVSETFERLLHKHTAAKAANPVTSALWEQFRTPMIKAGWFKLLNSTLNLLPPILLNFLLSWLADASRGVARNPAWEGYVWAAALYCSFAFRTFVENAYFHRVVRVGFQIRTALTTTVYRKALRLSPVARQETPTGQVVNLMQLDATRVDSMMMQFHVTWDGLYQIVTNMILLGWYIGPSALAGLFSMVLLIPINFFFMMRQQVARRAIVKENDLRVKVMNEILQGIRAVKLYAWENFFVRKVLRIRESELLGVRGYAVQQAVNSTIMMCGECTQQGTAPLPLPPLSLTHTHFHTPPATSTVQPPSWWQW